MTDQDGWQFQGRKANGEFGTGTKPKDDAPSSSDVGGGGKPAPASPGDRFRAAVNGAVGHFDGAERTTYAVRMDQHRINQLAGAMAVWDRSAGLDRDAFRTRFLDPRASDSVVDLLRAAARGAAAQATTQDGLRDAAGQVAAAAKAVGLDNWPRFVADASARTGAAVYVADNPRQWISSKQVGNGECVALVQRATGAPTTDKWQAGALVQGNTSLPPGTAIAVFDADGKYGNHTDNTSHAALLLR
jgi:hypothetical protein